MLRLGQIRSVWPAQSGSLSGRLSCWTSVRALAGRKTLRGLDRFGLQRTIGSCGKNTIRLGAATTSAQPVIRTSLAPRAPGSATAIGLAAKSSKYRRVPAYHHLRRAGRHLLSCHPSGATLLLAGPHTRNSGVENMTLEGGDDGNFRYWQPLPRRRAAFSSGSPKRTAPGPLPGAQAHRLRVRQP
jgi:hypothetical protein